MKDGPESNFDALADFELRLEEAQKAIENTSWGKGMAELESAKSRARARRATKNFDLEPRTRMTDAEIRGRLLEHFYNLRHSNGGWVPANDMIFNGGEPVRWETIAGVCGQLDDVGLIEWKPLRGHEGIVAVNAKITGQGVAAVEAGRSSEIDIRFPSKNVTAPGAPSMTNDPPISDAALTEVREAVITLKAELPALTLSNSEKANIKQIEVETSSTSETKEILTLKPAFMGMSVDLKELWRRIDARRKRRK